MRSMRLATTVLAALICLVAFSASPVEGATGRDVLPAVQSFLNQHPEFSGKVFGVKNVKDWAGGKRQTLRLSSGTYLFYEQDGEVVSVYRIDTERTLAWQKPGYESPSATIEEKQGTRAAQAGLPSYEVIEAIKLLRGGVYGEVLIKSVSRSTPAAVREQALREIARKEGFTSAALYCSRDAFKANNSASFARAHPNALETCYLGGLQSGKFLPGEALYP